MSAAEWIFILIVGTPIFWGLLDVVMKRIVAPLVLGDEYTARNRKP